MQKTDKGDVFGSTLAIDFTFSVCIISFTHTLSTTITKIENARKNKHVKDRKLGSTKRTWSEAESQTVYNKPMETYNTACQV